MKKILILIAVFGFSLLVNTTIANTTTTTTTSTTTTGNTTTTGSNTSGSSSSTTTVIPDVIKLNINHSARKLTGTKNNAVPNATLDFELYSHQHPTASVALGSTPGTSGNFSIDIPPGGKFSTLSVEDGYFIGSFTELPGVGEAVLDKIRVKISGATAKDNLGFTLTNVVNSNTNGNSAGSNTANTNNPGTGSNTANTNNPGTGSNTANTNSTVEDIEKLEDPLGEGTTLEGLILKLFEIIMYIGVPLVAFFLIWSGFMFVAAQGNEEKLQTAKNRLLYTIIGAIILLGAWTISQAIKGTVEDIKSGGQAQNYTLRIG